MNEAFQHKNVGSLYGFIVIASALSPRGCPVRASYKTAWQFSIVNQRVAFRVDGHCFLSTFQITLHPTLL